MKTLIKFIESLGFKCEMDRDVLVIKTGKIYEWVNGYNETMTQEGYIRVYKLESYKYNNYGVSWSTGYSLSLNKDCHKIEDVKKLLEELLK